MAGGGPTSQGSKYTHNDAAFVEYNTRLQSGNLPTFTTAASKLTEWLGSDKAYYPNARVPIVSIIESAHANICRVQGDPSSPFTADKALPGLDPWYQPYFSLLKQVGSHLNHFEPELKARLQLLVENAGIKVVQVPTLTDNSTTQPKPFTPTERLKEDLILVNASSQAAGPSNQGQQPRTVSPTTVPELQRKGRRKLNSAIFEADTAAALRTKAVDVNNSEAITQHEATGAVHPPVRLTEGPTERALNVENLAEEQPQVKTKGNDPLIGVTVAGSSHIRTENSMLPEVGGVESPRERPSICLPEAEPGGHGSQPGLSEAPIANLSPEEVGKFDQGPPDARPETSPEPIATEPSTDSLIPAPSSEGADERVEIHKRAQDVSRIVEDVGRGVVSPNSLGNGNVHGTIQRRKGHDLVDGERSEMFLEPPAKRIRTESEATTIITPSLSASRPITPGAPTAILSLSVTHRVQRSSSDMIIESEDEASPTSPLDNRAADEKTNNDNNPPSLEQQPFTEPQSGALARKEQAIEETPMPPIQDLSLTSPEIKPNPFTACRIPLYPPGALPEFLRPTVIPDVGRLSLLAPAVSHPLNSVSTTALQTPDQRTYVFSAADIHTLVASRGSDEDSGPNKLVFNLDWGSMNGITKWRNFKVGQGPLEGSACLSLACYPVDSVAAMMNTATENQPFDALIRQARVKSSWPSGLRFRSTLKDDSGKSYAIPPFSTTDDDFIDISESAIPGTNTYTIESNGQSLSDWLFAVYVHSPTIAYFDALQMRVDKEKKWVGALTSFSTYSLPTADWDTLG